VAVAKHGVVLQGCFDKHRNTMHGKAAGAAAHIYVSRNVE
jgi:hypothetical protein